MPDGVAPKVRNAHPFTVYEYIGENNDSLDARSFPSMKEAGVVKEFPELYGFKHLTESGGWMNSLNHWNYRNCLTIGVRYDNIDVPYVRTEGEGV